MWWMEKESKPKSERIQAKCPYCHKTDFRANMIEGSYKSEIHWVDGKTYTSYQMLWMHAECDRKARKVKICPKCGKGEVAISARKKKK